jgi:hypothetical protein
MRFSDPGCCTAAADVRDGDTLMGKANPQTLARLSVLIRIRGRRMATSRVWAWTAQVGYFG